MVGVGTGYEMSFYPVVVGFEKSLFKERTQLVEHTLPQVPPDMSHEKSCFRETCVRDLELSATVVAGGDIRALCEPIHGVHVGAKEG